MKRKTYDALLILVFCAVILPAPTSANTLSAHSPFAHCGDIPFYPDLERDYSLPKQGMSPAKIGGIIDGGHLIWGESIGWVNLRTIHADLKIGSNILAGWIWLENCGWVCLGNGHPLEGERYSSLGAYDWGINNDGRGNLSGYAWSEVTGWISFRTGHSRVYLNESGQFYGYAWGENVGWMHFGPGSRVQYLAKADPGPWKEIGKDAGYRLADGPVDSEMTSGSAPVSGLKANNERYNKDSDSVCSFRVERDDSCAHFRCCDNPVHICCLSGLSSIRAPPVIA
ncbi:MAG: hypothetical protein NTZ78_02745 [Candidatus Aureabacteria bacterium]|nr:hypothetical protein [Candidatus Auribacterota bacterium]